MWQYGRKVVDALFKRWTKRIAVCAELESKLEADSSRSNIRVFEIGLSSQQYGDYEQGTRNAAYEAESARLISIAKENGLFISPKEWMRFGDRKRLQSGESIVYLNPQGNRIIKVRNPFAKSAIKQLHAQDTIYEHLIHNLFFPSTRYHFEGISEDVDGVRIILSQPYISDKYFAPTQAEIDNYLIEKLGLKIEDRYFYGNEHIAVTDVSAEGDNVLSDEEQLYFIDPIIKMKRPAIEVLDYYYQFLK